MKNQIKYFAIIFSVLVLFSCKDKNSYSKMNSTQMSVKNDAHKIVPNEVVNGGSYTYLYVEDSGTNYWMAIPSTEVKVGETYYYNGGMVMKDFESKQLNKTFDLITFVDGIRITPEIKSAKQKNPHTNTNPSTDTLGDLKITLPENGISLAELFSKKESFSKKSIIVKGKVVKVNNGILDKNWIHIVDGTQFENKKSLTVTTTEMVKVGDTVTFKGIVTLDKDFGKGYVYPILLEEGELLK